MESPISTATSNAEERWDQATLYWIVLSIPVHIALGIVFALLSVWPLALFNVGSVLIWAVAYGLYRQGHRRAVATSALFADLVGFTRLSEQLDAEQLVSLLDRIFRDLDAVVAAHGAEKIKTIGDAYMVAAGVPDPRDDHAEVLVTVGQEILKIVARHGAEHGVLVRVGIHSGPVVAGVIGKHKFSYDLWGDTVNTASRMESHGVEGRIQVSEGTRQLLPNDCDLEPRGVISVKGKGEMPVWLVV